MLDKELVDRAEKIGELEVLVAEASLVEMDDELPPLRFRDLLLPDLSREVDSLDDVFQSLRVGFFQSGQRNVKPISYFLMQFVVEVTPPGFFGNEESADFLIATLLIGPYLRVALSSLESQLFAHDLIMSLVKNVRTPAEEQHAEDEFLVVGSIHRIAQDICRLVEVSFQLRQSQLAYGCLLSHPPA